MKKGLISILSLGILVLSFASGYLINDVAKRQKTKYPDSFLRLYEVYNIIQNVSFEDRDEQLLCQGAISGMVSALNDPNTFIEGDPLFDYVFDDRNQGKGLNLSLSIPLSYGYPKVIDGKYLRSGDKIISINGIDTEKLSLNEIEELLSYDCRFKILRDDVVIYVHNPYTFYVNEYVSYKTIDEIGYIKINSFDCPNLEAYQDFKSALSELEKSGIKGLIIDIRNNNGGNLNNVRGILQELVSGQNGDLMFELVSKNSTTYEVETLTGVPNYFLTKKDYDIKVLVNEYTSSEAEMFAAVLGEYMEYDIIGNKTRGHNTHQEIIKINEQCNLHITTGSWYYFNQNQEKLNVEGGYTPNILISQLPFFDTEKPVVQGNILIDTVSEEAKAVQKMLYTLGHDIRIDGYLDEKTLLAVKNETNSLILSSEEIEIIFSKFISYVEENDLQLIKALELLGA